MSLSLTSNFVAVTNLTLPLAQTAGVPGIAIRVASLTSGVLGILTASGAAGVIAFTISPSAPSFVTGSVDVTGTIFTISFSHALPNGPDPYEFYVTVTDGVTTLYFPILMEVKEPFAIQAVGNGTTVLTTGATTFSVPSFDSSQADVEIQGIGLNNAVVSGVYFVPPTLPAGLNFIDSNGSAAFLHVSEPTASIVSGGLQLITPVSVPLTLSAYLPGSFYDEPDRAYTQTFQISSLTSKQGTIDIIADVYYDNVNARFQLDLFVDYLQGQGHALQYAWTQSAGTAAGVFSAATGSVVGGTASATWTPTVGGTVTFTVTVSDQINPHPVYAIKSFPSFETSTGSSSWASTPAIKLQLSTAPGAPGLYQGFVGDTIDVIVSAVNTSEFNVAETFFLTITAETGSNLESPVTTPVGLTLTSSNLTATIPITIPAASFREKWGIRIAAANATIGPTRTGFAEATLRTFGNKTLIINGNAPIAISSSTGSVMTPVTLTAVDIETSAPVAAAFSLVGAPAGVFISGNQITGNALIPGAYTFSITAVAAGYANSYSNTVTLTVAQNATPLIISTPSVVGANLNPPVEVNNANFNVQWSLIGTPSTLLFLQSTSTNGSRSVLGTTQASTTQPTTSVISVYGSSFYGTSYSLPIIVLSSSIQASSALLPSPTIATIDSNNNLTINWQPFIVDGGYTIYKDWDIYLTSVPGGTPQLQLINGNLPTGLEFPGSSVSNRIYESVVAPGNYTLNMTALTSNPSIATNSPAWDSSHQFPPALTTSSIQLSAGTLQLGQPLTISLNPAYTGASVWSITYADNTTTGFVPLSVRSFAKSFSTPGNQQITIITENDFTANNPQVKLRREIVVTVFVTNQQFSSTSATGTLTGTLGISGQQGFEITDATTASVTPEPWEVISRSLVRDTVTNELKLFVATSRFADASSLLDTMAADVFPLQGRPLSLELLDIPALLETTAKTGQTPVKITTSVLPSIIVGKAMTEFKLQASGGVSPYSWYTDGTLPFGLNLSIDGTLSGTPLELGTFNVDFSVADSSVPESIADETFPLIIATDLVIITTSPLPAAVVNTPYSQQIANTGGLPPFTWSVVSGALPLGLSINPSSGLLSGSPVSYNSTTDFLNPYNATIQITDSIGAQVSSVFSIQLNPATLSLGPGNQTIVDATDQFKIVVPVFGGKSPYTLTAFTDDGVIGSGLQIINPTQVTVVGIASATLTIPDLDQTFYPQAAVDVHGNFTNPLGVPVSITLTSTGGVAPIQYSIDPTASNTLPGNGTGDIPQVFGTELLGVATANGTFTVGIKAIDAVGHIATRTINVVIQAQNSTTYTISPVSVNLNGSPTTPGAWTVAPLAALPDAVVGSPYNPGAGQVFGFALYQSGTLYYIAEPLGNATYGLLSGTWPAWMSVLPPNGVATAPGIVFINQTGGSTPNAGNVGSTSNPVEFSNIVQPSLSNFAIAVKRESITVRSFGTGTSPVIVVVDTTAVTIDLATTTGAWLYPLVAEGGTGPYTFQLQSGTTLPGVTITGGVDNTVYFTTSTQLTGTYNVVVIATDSASNVSAATTIPVTVIQSPQQPIHILNNNMPAYLYAGRPIPANTYFIQSDLVANWTATGLPAGVTFTAAAGTRTYLQGTPTTPSTTTIVVTATSASFGTTATQNFPLQIRARSASMVNFPASAVVGVAYRAVNNNAILNVAYVGYQPTDADLPLLVSSNGTVGMPGVFNAGQPTTQVSNLTADGFNMAFDYTNSTVGNDTITSSGNPITGLPATLAIVYSTLVATGTMPSTNTVSEYALTATFPAPVSIVGGNPPYSIDIVGESDSRFVPVNNNTANAQLMITVNQFAPGGTYTCSVSMTVSDTETSPQTSSTTGVLTVTIEIETTITVQYNNQSWTLTEHTSPGSASIVLPVLGVTVQLAHLPVQYNVTSVTIPPALTGIVIASPTNRVLAINSTGTTINFSDVNASLTPSGSFNVPSTSPASVPTGSFTIGVNYQVVDVHGITSIGSANVNVTIS
jgi:hypothetical protein